MDLAQAQEFFGAYGLITADAMLLNNPRALDEVYDRYSELVDSDLEVRTWKQMMPELVEGIELDYYGGLVMIYVLYAIIGFGIFGTFLMMTRERTYEFGILTAIGMKKGKIRRMVALEILLISFLGVAIGLLLSAPILVYFHYNPIVFTGDYAEVFENFGYEPVLPFSLDAVVFYSQGVVVLLISLFLGLYPMWYIHQLRTVKALKA
jgi:ABC-type lipoprotein release transport system permease subunit